MKNIEIVNSNAKVILENFVLDSLNINTSNASIRLNNLKVLNSVNLKTSNAKIELNKVSSSSDYIINTTNAAVDIKELVAKNVEVNSNNGAIKLHNINATSIDAKTSNASIYCNVIGNREDYNSKLYTKNARISIDDEKMSDTNIEKNYNNALKTIYLKTDNAGIDLKFSN